jgi:hypothetical protein
MGKSSGGSVADLSLMPTDPNVSTFFVGNVDGSNVSEEQLRAAFHRFADVDHVKIISDRGFGFVGFRTRVGAEETARRLLSLGKLVVNGVELKLAWSKPRGTPAAERHPAGQYAGAIAAAKAAVDAEDSGLPPPSASGSEESQSSGASSSTSSSAAPAPIPKIVFPTLPPPPGMRTSAQLLYPSQDPKQYGGPT